MPRYCYERDRHETHRLRYEECHQYWVIYDRKKGYGHPIAFTEDLIVAQQIIDALNSRLINKG